MLPAHKRLQSYKEEIANGVSHGIALVGCLVATPFLLSSAARIGDAWNVAGAAIFAGAMFFMYLSSALYHVLPENRTKRVLRVLDHVAIFFLIAGTYTPFTLGVLRGSWGWTLFSIVWSLAVLGVALKIKGALWHPLISTGLYLAMGWLIVVAIRPLWLKVPLPECLNEHTTKKGDEKMDTPKSYMLPKDIDRLLAEADELIKQIDSDAIKDLEEEHRIQFEAHAQRLKKLRSEVQEKIDKEGAPEGGAFGEGMHQAIDEIVTAMKNLGSYFS